MRMEKVKVNLRKKNKSKKDDKEQIEKYRTDEKMCKKVPKKTFVFFLKKMML